MPMDSAREQSHHQEVGGAQTLESMVANSKAAPEKKPRPAENSLKCPRCESTNTKFCYYNNYSLSQPRYFCKSCRRYWTKGGTLRNVPVGGGCRKNKRSSSSSSGSARRHNHDNPKITPPSYAATPPPYETDLLFHKPPSGLVGILDEPGMSGGDYGLVEALRGGGFLEIQRGFHNFYGGNGNGIGNGDGVSFGMECGPGFGMGMGTGIEIGVLNREMGLMGFEDFGNGGAVASVKQEARNGEQWGLSPWPNVGGEDLDPARIGSWNGIGSSSWHGLLNSPLV